MDSSTKRSLSINEGSIRTITVLGVDERAHEQRLDEDPPPKSFDDEDLPPDPFDPDQPDYRR
jgi:hypothetical protein